MNNNITYMRIESIQIKGLFEIFEYDISLDNKENLYIITGPNGFGKTMILNIIFNLFNRRFDFFEKLVFGSIDITLTGNISILITKIIEEKSSTKFEFTKDNHNIGGFEYPSIDTQDFLNLLSTPIWSFENSNSSELQSSVMPTLKKLSIDYTKLLSDNNYYVDISNANRKFTIPNEIINILNSVKVHLIQEQRLFTKVQNASSTNTLEKNQTLMVETINAYAKELQEQIIVASQVSLKTTQQLESSYPGRLVKETSSLNKEEYDEKFQALKAKQVKLSKYGLYEGNQEELEYSATDSKALYVYLNDLEKKLGVFDELLEKLELFTGILNERRFTFKSIQVDREEGFYFKTSKGTKLELSQLSSGEQHEVVLLFELIFNAQQNVVVLIDEPEISLHVTWQKEFLNDLLKIIEIQQFQVIVATHSPSIIHDRWDLVYNLETSQTA